MQQVGEEPSLFRAAVIHEQHRVFNRHQAVVGSLRNYVSFWTRLFSEYVGNDKCAIEMKDGVNMAYVDEQQAAGRLLYDTRRD